MGGREEGREGGGEEGKAVHTLQATTPTEIHSIR